MSDVELISLPREGSRLFRRVITDPNITVIDVVVNHPNGAPIRGVVSLVPPFAALSALEQALEDIEFVTGVDIISTGALVSNPDITSTTFLAHVVLPVLITIIVLTLVVGVIILLIVV